MAVAETAAPKATAYAAASDAVPTVIADNVNIIYKVTASGGKGTAASAFRRILKRQDRPTIREVHAVKNVSFTAYKGDAIGLIGRNGSGKSTLLRAIAGLLPPASGAIYTGGQPSLLGVNAAMMNDLTGDRNVVLGCLAMGMTLAEIEERYDDIVEFSGIGDFIDLPMSTYSSGMSARLKFAIASAKTHDILLVDEALATGDAEFRVRSEKKIKELRSSAGCVFLVSHSLDVVLDTCNRAIWLDKGVLRMDGDVKEVVEAYNQEATGKR
ncbi:teichoic acid transport system ATP-binding protein [Kribbella voronezhensis]|uniref:Teichoic acid transport system ATP-binding protein n=1 Tax=Kribbella voronezhensis TaxID=2512212 RepID=A0A4R7TAR8_9ACTN|nr:ABC transporter ATP-binding protein [Kribbella voronezhensis]TDU88496.1 teichoic acid transport system ATP-binding protein [Kribbella voronezhensis]